MAKPSPCILLWLVVHSLKTIRDGSYVVIVPQSFCRLQQACPSSVQCLAVDFCIYFRQLLGGASQRKVMLGFSLNELQSSINSIREQCLSMGWVSNQTSYWLTIPLVSLQTLFLNLLQTGKNFVAGLVCSMQLKVVTTSGSISHTARSLIWNLHHQCLHNPCPRFLGVAGPKTGMTDGYTFLMLRIEHRSSARAVRDINY